MDSMVGTLKAMAVNYANGHQWDKLDSEACNKAAAEIERLTRQREDLLNALDEYLYNSNSDSTACWIKLISTIRAIKGEKQ